MLQKQLAISRDDARVVHLLSAMHPHKTGSTDKKMIRKQLAISRDDARVVHLRSAMHPHKTGSTDKDQFSVIWCVALPLINGYTSQQEWHKDCASVQQSEKKISC